jgi:hypothetical protein
MGLRVGAQIAGVEDGGGSPVHLGDHPLEAACTSDGLARDRGAPGTAVMFVTCGS